ncbi:preprotein translocase subunit SecG [Candidatus Dependentiae bacterium]
MLYGFLLTIYIILCLFLVLLVLIQKGKSSLGLGSLGGGAQALFGGGGGQDIFQKVTWILVAIFLLGSLGLSLMKTSMRHSFKYANTQKAAPKPLTDTTPSPDLKNPVTIPTPEKSGS